MDECQCASFFAQSAQTPVTAMRQPFDLRAGLPFDLRKGIRRKLQPVDVADRAADAADEVRVGIGTEIKAFQSVVDADGIDRALVLEHGEVSIDRRERPGQGWWA